MLTLQHTTTATTPIQNLHLRYEGSANEANTIEIESDYGPTYTATLEKNVFYPLYIEELCNLSDVFMEKTW